MAGVDPKNPGDPEIKIWLQGEVGEIGIVVSMFG